jgi:hypothetical protein
MTRRFWLDANLTIDDGRVRGRPNKATRTGLGLSGEYHITGLYEYHLPDDVSVDIERIDVPFTMSLTPATTALAVLCEAAKAHKATFHGHGDHIFFESIEIGDGVIVLGMGS